MNEENLINSTEDNESPKENGILDVAKMEVQCHFIIKDIDTNEILVNKRG